MFNILSLSSFSFFLLCFDVSCFHCCASPARGYTYVPNSGLDLGRLYRVRGEADRVEAVREFFRKHNLGPVVRFSVGARPCPETSPQKILRANDDLYALGRRAGTLLSRPEKILDRADDHKNFAGEICN